MRFKFKFQISIQKVKIAYEALEFPTVTFCNINPIRTSMSRRFGSDDLVDFLDRLKPRATFRDQDEGQGQKAWEQQRKSLIVFGDG